MRARLRIGCTLLLAAPILAAAGGRLDYEDLVRRLWDLERLTEPPRPGERCAQWSSWDRASRYDESADQYIAWNANGDGSGFIREEGDELLLAEMKGPGCIWRVWSAMPGPGQVRLVLDGETVLALPFTNWFTGRHYPFDFPNLAYSAARGHNLYVPIPYQRSCRVLASSNWGRYYHFTYSSFPADTEVPTFRANLTESERAALAEADRRLGAALAEDVPLPPGAAVVETQLVIAAGARALTLRLEGPRRVVEMRALARSATPDDEAAALRHLVLRVRWDGDGKPAVECPLGDFFGSAPGRHPFRTWVAAMTPEWMIARWPMPFSRLAEFEIANDGPTSRSVRLRVAHVPEPRPAGRFLRFHAAWHRGLPPPRPDRAPDWPFLIAEGQGRFCGLMLHVWNPIGGAYEPAKPGHWWWGEGDEKFFVDGELFPSTFGTGTEDYFGYAWCCPVTFARPFHAQTVSEDNAGHQSVARWHVADNVPFQTCFEGCLEKYFPDDRPTLYAATVYWYMAPGGRHAIRLPPVAERYGYAIRPPLSAGGHRVVTPPPHGRIRTQNMSTFSGGRWSNNDQLWWTGGQPGDRVEISIAAPQPGRYRLAVTLTKANDYGIVQFDLDGERCSSPVDLYHPAVIRTAPFDLGEHVWGTEPRRLGVTILGANPKARPSYMFGLDEVLLSPVAATSVP